MARKITTDATHAFTNGQEFNRGNTRVEVRPFQQEAHDSVILLLHGNPIARYVKSSGLSTLQVCDGNCWQTVTTKDRLNGLPGVSVHQKAGDWYLNGVKWDGSWTRTASVIVIKKLGLRSFGVEYPHAAAMPPMQFPSLKAARAFAEVEAANHGFKLVVEDAA